MTPALRTILFGSGISNQASIVLSRLPVTPTATQRAAYVTLVDTLVTGAVWARLDILNVACPGAQANTLTNLIQPLYNSTTNATFNSGTGTFTGNGSSFYVDLNCNPTTAVGLKFTQDSAFFHVWSADGAQDAGGAFGQVTGTPKNNLYTLFTDNKTYGRANVAASSSANSIAGLGGFEVNRSSSTVQTLGRKGYPYFVGSTTASSAPDNANLCVGRDRTAFSTGTWAAWASGGSLSAAQQLILDNAISAFLLAVGAVTKGQVVTPIIPGSVSNAVTLLEPEDVLVIGNYAYVPCRAGASLAVIDISNSLSPTIVQSFTDVDLTQGMGIAANDDGTVLYLTSWHNCKLLILNASSPAAVSKISSITIGASGVADELRKVVYRGGYCFCTHNDEGKLYIVDVRTAASPSIVGSVATGDHAFAVAVEPVRDYAYVAGFPGTKVNVVDFSNKSAPAIVKTLTDAVNYSGVSCLSVVGSLLVATFYASETFVTFNIASPTNMVQYSILSLATLPGPNRFYSAGDLTYVVSALGDSIGVLNTANYLSVSILAITVSGTLLDSAYGVCGSNTAGTIYTVSRNSNNLAVVH